MRRVLGTWNPDVALSKMFKLTLKQIMNLEIGTHVYYMNMADDISGAFYDAEVISKTPHMVVLKCKLVEESIPTHLMFSNDKEYIHTECFSYTDCCDGARQALFANLVFKKDLF